MTPNTRYYILGPQNILQYAKTKKKSCLTDPTWITVNIDDHHDRRHSTYRAKQNMTLDNSVIMPSNSTMNYAFSCQRNITWGARS